MLSNANPRRPTGDDVAPGRGKTASVADAPCRERALLDCTQNATVERQIIAEKGEKAAPALCGTGKNTVKEKKVLPIESEVHDWRGRPRKTAELVASGLKLETPARVKREPAGELPSRSRAQHAQWGPRIEHADEHIV